jgi:hypothetical protein
MRLSRLGRSLKNLRIKKECCPSKSKPLGANLLIPASEIRAYQGKRKDPKFRSL